MHVAAGAGVVELDAAGGLNRQRRQVPPAADRRDGGEEAPARGMRRCERGRGEGRACRFCRYCGFSHELLKRASLRLNMKDNAHHLVLLPAAEPIEWSA